MASPPATRSLAPELSFSVRDARALRDAAVPTLALSLAIEAAGGAAVRAATLGADVRIAAPLRAYGAGEQERLADLFGPAAGWSRSLRTLHWTRATVHVPAFTGSVAVDLPVTCTYDLEVAASAYMEALEDGVVPLELLFSGTVFHSGEDGRLQVVLLDRDSEATYRMPVAVWRETIDRHFPDTAWLRLRRSRLEALRAYRARHALPSWEAAVDALLAGEEERR